MALIRKGLQKFSGIIAELIKGNITDDKIVSVLVFLNFKSPFVKGDKSKVTCLSIVTIIIEILRGILQPFQIRDFIISCGLIRSYPAR